MRAYVLEADDTAAFREVESPTAGPGEVQIRVRASSLNPHDLHVLSGAARAYLEYDLPAILGSDVAGEVEAVGPGVGRVRVGDRVFGLQRSSRVHNGTFAEHAVLPETSVAKTPDNIDDAHAGALGLAAIAALTAIDAAQPGTGSTVLINGATGGVGSYAIQLAVLRGARVLATARAGAATDLVRELGASITIDWTIEDVAKAAADAGGADVLLDFVNVDVDALESLSRRALAPGGRAFTTLVPTSSAQMLVAVGSPEMLDRIAVHAARGELVVPLRDTFPLTQVEQAFAALRAGALGKIGLDGRGSGQWPPAADGHDSRRSDRLPRQIV